MITIDDFLGGRVRLKQYKNGLRATSDSVLLASSVPAKEGETILDVGTGNGVVSCCLNARINHLKITGVDCQKELLDLAQQNAEINNCVFDMVEMDIFKRPSPLHGKQFHHVVTNPPFYIEEQKPIKKQIDIAYHQKDSLTEWIGFCLRHLRAKGSFCIIHRIEALPEILTVLNNRLGGIEIFPIISRKGETANRIIVRGFMNSRKPLKLYSFV